MNLSLQTRSSGILLHPTSLPGPFGLGDIGPEARRFIDFLQAAGQSFWQMLPVHPIGGGNSPYDSASAFAGATHLISLEDLVRDGWLDADSLAALPRPQDPTVADFDYSRRVRPGLWRRSFSYFLEYASEQHKQEFEQFLEEARSWIWDWALFCALKNSSGQTSWPEWPAELRARQAEALQHAHEVHRDEVRLEAYRQFAFHHQWRVLKSYAAERNVRLMGDIPMFIAHDSADVWANQSMFFLDEEGRRTVQAGVPPDYFSEDGQLWGNPLYRWDVMQERGYSWWIDRLGRELSKFDAVRLDHFIAFHRYWEVPIDARTAREGRYVEVPGEDFLTRARERLGDLPLVAEDLGIITGQVEALRDALGLPGMKVLQFAFSPGAESYLPHRHPRLSVAYTGTHDNNTTRGWYETLLLHAVEEAEPSLSQQQMAAQAKQQLDRIRAYTGVSRAGEVTRGMLRTLLSSQAMITIFPLQDALDEGEEARMNVPGTASGNWTYRVPPGALTAQVAARLAELVCVTERKPQ